MVAIPSSGFSSVPLPSTPHLSTNSLCEKIAQAVSNLFSQAQTFLSTHQLTFTVIRYGFYGMRIPFIYLEYFVHDMIHDTPVAIIGNVLYLFCEIGYLGKWFEHLNLINLGKISAFLGKSSFLSSLSSCPIGAGLNIISGIASVFFAVNYSIKLAKGNLPRQQRIAIWFGLTASVVHIVAIAVFLTSGSSLFPVTLGLTGISVAFYIVYWFLHRYPIKCLS